MVLFCSVKLLIFKPILLCLLCRGRELESAECNVYNHGWLIKQMSPVHSWPISIKSSQWMMRTRQPTLSSAMFPLLAVTFSTQRCDSQCGWAWPVNTDDCTSMNRGLKTTVIPTIRISETNHHLFLA